MSIPAEIGPPLTYGGRPLPDLGRWAVRRGPRRGEFCDHRRRDIRDAGGHRTLARAAARYPAGISWLVLHEVDV